MKILKDSLFDLQQRKAPVFDVAMIAMGISDPEAISNLVSFANVERKVAWHQDNNLRLHVKAWRFHYQSNDVQNTAFSIAIIGSLTISKFAQSMG